MKTKIKRVALDLLRKLVKKYLGVTLPRFIKGDVVYWRDVDNVLRGTVLSQNDNFDNRMSLYYIEKEDGTRLRIYDIDLHSSFQEARNFLAVDRKTEGEIIKALGGYFKNKD